ncbi:MAG TPA: hypothetical protein VGM88_20100 [Kofleriaceae bacterium]|jgi:hypothetical protein
MSGFEKARSGATGHAPDAAATEAKPVGAAAVQYALDVGMRDPSVFRGLLAQYPHDRDAMLALLHQARGNAFVQQVVVAPFEAERGEEQVATQLDATVRATLIPAYRRAVDALDADATAELGQRIVELLAVSARADDDAHVAVARGPALVSTAGSPIEDLAATTINNYTALSGEQLRASTALASLYHDAAVQLGPQLFRGAPVMGALSEPTTHAPLEVVANEAATTAALLATVTRARTIAGATGPSSVALDDAQRAEIAALVEPWHGRPVSFAFLSRALGEVGLWTDVAGAKGPSGRTLEETAARASAQAKLTGALADVDDFDPATLDELRDPTGGGNPLDTAASIGFGGFAQRGDVAHQLLDQLRDAAPDARGALIRLIQRRGKLRAFCDGVEPTLLDQLAAAIAPFDAHAADALWDYVEASKLPRSLHARYADAEASAESTDHPVRAFGWKALEAVHNTVTGGLERELGEEQDARSAGLLSRDAYGTAAFGSFGKSALVMAASFAAGGAAESWASGFAAPLGEGGAAAISGAAGGVAGGLAGHFAGDVYGQAFEGKDGFDSPRDYAVSGAIGGAVGLGLSGLSVAAGRFVDRGVLSRRADVYAARFPRLTRFLEAARATGARQRVFLTAKAGELADLLSHLGPPPSGLAPALVGIDDLRALPPDTDVQFSLHPTADLNRPMQMSMTGGGGPDDPLPLAVDAIEIRSNAESETAPREAASDPARTRILAKGMSAAELDALVAKHGPQVVPAVDQLLQAGLAPRQIQTCFRLAEPHGVVPDMLALVGSGRLRQLSGFAEFMEELDANASGGSPGTIDELRLAARRAAQGHPVSLGGGADVIDYQDTEALQLKTITSPQVRTAIDNLDKAIRQIRGEHGEVPPQGFHRTVRLRIANPRSVLYGASRESVLAELRGNLQEAASDDITVVIENGTQELRFALKELL